MEVVIWGFVGNLGLAVVILGFVGNLALGAVLLCIKKTINNFFFKELATLKNPYLKGRHFI